MWSSNPKFLAVLFLILAPGIYFVATKNWQAPSGAWASETETCQSGAVTYYFGDSITVSDGKERKVFGSDALYYRQPNGELRISFITELQGRKVNIAINYDSSQQALVPRSMRMGTAAFVSTFPDSFRKNFTFRRCS